MASPSGSRSLRPSKTEATMRRDQIQDFESHARRGWLPYLSDTLKWLWGNVSPGAAAQSNLDSVVSWHLDMLTFSPRDHPHCECLSGRGRSRKSPKSTLADLEAVTRWWYDTPNPTSDQIWRILRKASRPHTHWVLLWDIIVLYLVRIWRPLTLLINILGTDIRSFCVWEC